MEWILVNPGFFDEYSEEIRDALNQSRSFDHPISDLRDYLLRKIQMDINALQARETELLKAARDNSIIHEQIFSATLAILQAVSFDTFIETITTKLTEIFNIEVSILFFEGSEKVFQADNRVILAADLNTTPKFFEGLAKNIRSCAYLKLKTSDASQTCFLALGSVNPRAFHPSQRTEFLYFFSDILEVCLEKWLIEKKP
ncbi:MAG: DUF484 family protein [Rhodospirillaceae bacterium]